MKKEYTNPTIEIVILDVEDIVTTSGYDADNIMESENYDNWFM